MADVRSGVIEITWGRQSDYDNPAACESIVDFLKEGAKLISFQKPRECLAPEVKITYGDVQRCHHAFVQVTLGPGGFSAYVRSLQLRAREHDKLATAVWRRRTSIVAYGAARLGTVCLGAQQFAP